MSVEKYEKDEQIKFRHFVLSRWLHPLAKLAKPLSRLSSCCHVCRHTYCSNMAKSGMNPKTLQYLMGHSDIAVTLNVYTHVGLEDAEKELQKMQGLENARKEMGISDKDDKPLKQNMFKVI